MTQRSTVPFPIIYCSRLSFWHSPQKCAGHVIHGTKHSVSSVHMRHHNLFVCPQHKSRNLRFPLLNVTAINSKKIQLCATQTIHPFSITATATCSYRVVKKEHKLGKSPVHHWADTHARARTHRYTHICPVDSTPVANLLYLTVKTRKLHKGIKVQSDLTSWPSCWWRLLNNDTHSVTFVVVENNNDEMSHSECSGVLHEWQWELLMLGDVHHCTDSRWMQKNIS